MLVHFEEIWEKAEQIQQSESKENTISSIIEELLLIINCYKAIDSKKEIPENDMKSVKSRMIGEILLTIAAMSLKENINVAESLNSAILSRDS